MEAHNSISHKTSPNETSSASAITQVGDSIKDCSEESGLFVQCQLTVGAVDDPLEREADAVANTVMQMNEYKFIKNKCSSGEEDEIRRFPLPFIQTKSDAGPTGIKQSSADKIDASRGQGNNLDNATKSFMENRFNADFSQVKIHTGEQPSLLSKELNAQAFTLGNDIYFNQGKYAPETSNGKHLLAHELTHVIQQSGQVRPKVQRRIREAPVVRDFQRDAQVCMVHLHGDEQNAFHTAQNLHGRFCSNFVHLSYGTPPERLIHTGSGSSSCQADPNRIFNDAGIEATLRQNNRARRCRGIGSSAGVDLKNFRDINLMPAIQDCSKASDGTRLPIVAFHNNTQGALSIDSYSSRGSERGATETDATRLGTRTNPSIATGQDHDNFLLVTDTRDFDAFSGSRNVVLQSTTPSDDGSLSVTMAAERYINIESQEDTFRSATNPFFVENLAAGEAVMHQLGVNPCPAMTKTPSSPTVRRREDPNRTITPERPREVREPTLWDRLLILLERIIAWLRQLIGLSGPSLRDPIPAQLLTRCRTFNNQAELDARKAVWQTTIASMPIADVVKWITGVNNPPRAAKTESESQKNCLLDAIQIAAGTSSSGIQLPTLSSGQDPHVEWTESGHRNFNDQNRIWQRKFNFTGRPFDRITPAAVAACPSAGLTAGQQWDPGNSRHATCWRSLTAEQKQREILQASSAPGISRHHWGTDFDLFSVEPTEWASGGVGSHFADEYTWLQRNAASYGFIQSFTSTSVPAGSQGYMEEKWHWSYYPISQALLEFATAHRTQIQAELRSQWGTSPEFSFINSHWSEFMFNVSSRAQF